MKNELLLNKKEKSNIEIFSKACEQFHSSAEIIEIAGIFFHKTPIQMLFADKSEKGKKRRLAYKKVCLSLKEDIKNMNRSFKIFEGCLNKF